MQTEKSGRSLDDIIRCYRAVRDSGITLTTLDGLTAPAMQQFLNGIPRLIAIAEAAEAILLCGDLEMAAPKSDRDRRRARLQDAIAPSNPQFKERSCECS